MRSLGFTCPMCGVVFLLKARYDQHREGEIPRFAAWSAEKRAAAVERWRARQIESGRMTADGHWVADWRP